MPWLADEGSPVVPLLFIAAFLWLSLAIGRRFLIVLGGARQGTLAERGVIAVALGASLLQYLPFALGAAGVLSVASLRIGAAVVVVAAGWDIVAVARASLRRARRGLHPAPWVLVWALTLLPALIVAGLLALAPTTDPDGLAYHLTVPKRWIEQGSLVYLPTYPYSNAPMGAEMLFALGLAFGGDAASKCVHFALGSTGVLGLYLAGKRLAGRETGALASTLYLVGPAGVCVVLGWAYVEGVASFAIIAAAVAWAVWFQSGERSMLHSAVLLAGFSVSFKITSVPLPAAMLALTCVALLDRDRRSGHPALKVSDALISAARLIPLAVAPLLPWMGRAAVITGNPFFPLFAKWIPSRDLSPDLSSKFDRFNRYMTWGNTFGRGWTFEQRQLVLFGVCAVVALGGVIILWRSVSLMARGTVAIVLGLVLVQLLAAGFYIRYSIPLAAVLTLPISLGLRPLLTHRFGRAAVVALALVLCLTKTRRALAEANFAAGDLPELVKTDAGLEDRRQFLFRHMGLYSLYEQVNRDLPKDAHVMLSCYCAGFYIDRKTFCAEMVQDSLRFSSWDDFLADVRRLGITHVIAPQALATGGPSPPLDLASVSFITRENQYKVVRPLLSKFSHPLGEALDQGLYEIDPALLAPH